ncbi:MAG: hypothetical protein U0936_06740 [Planctomycetaceae bacterium]
MMNRNGGDAVPAPAVASVGVQPKPEPETSASSGLWCTFWHWLLVLSVAEQRRIS